MDKNIELSTAIYGTPATGLTVEYAWNAGKAIADWLPTAGSVVVVYATSQQAITNAVIEGLRLQGRHVIDGGAGEGDVAIAHIKTSGLSGGVVVGVDGDLTKIEIYTDNARRVERESGLEAIHESVQAGNFVPAAVKGELTAIA